MKRHNKSYTSEYSVWTAMKNRCLNPRTPNYPKYGGAGIRVCERWIKSFQSFFEDMGSRPSLSHTLDRFPDQKGNYEPGNCRWATQVEQQNNRCDNIALTFNGKTQNISQWAREIGMDKTTLAQRIRNGWTHAKALTFPIDVRRLRKETTK